MQGFHLQEGSNLTFRNSAAFGSVLTPKYCRSAQGENSKRRELLLTKSVSTADYKCQWINQTPPQRLIKKGIQILFWVPFIFLLD